MMMQQQQGQSAGPVVEPSINDDPAPSVPREGAGKPATNASLLRFPNELLIPIIESAVRVPSSRLIKTTECENCSSWDGCLELRWDYSCLKTLSLVCRRFLEIAQPMLFHTIRFDDISWYRIDSWDYVRSSRRYGKLHRALKENPRLRDHCRTLQVAVPDPQGVETLSPSVAVEAGVATELEAQRRKYRFVNDFAKGLKNLQCLVVHGSFNSLATWKPNWDIWEFLRFFSANCPGITHLTLGGGIFGIEAKDVFARLEFPRLKILSVEDMLRWSVGKVKLEPEKYGSATFTSLSLVQIAKMPECILECLQWSATLSRFFLDTISEPRYAPSYAQLSSWLLLHKDTLRHISLGSLPRAPDKPSFNATLFPRLEYLRLSRWQHPESFREHQPEGSLEFQPDDAEILGPALKTFCWDLTSGLNYRDDDDRQYTFGKDEVVWITKFVEEAKARKSVFRTFQIQYQPEVSSKKHNPTYPWDLMDEMGREILSPEGMRLVYSAPFVSREEWQDYMERVKEGIESGVPPPVLRAVPEWERIKDMLEKDAAHESGENSDVEFESWFEGEEMEGVSYRLSLLDTSE